MLINSTIIVVLAQSISKDPHLKNLIKDALHTHNDMLPDHIEFTPNIAPMCPSFDDLDLFDGIINGECRDLRMRGNGYK